MGYNIHVAEAVTLQGQDLIKYANSVLDDYFMNHWHLDKEYFCADLNSSAFLLNRRTRSANADVFTMTGPPSSDMLSISPVDDGQSKQKALLSATARYALLLKYSIQYKNRKSMVSRAARNDHKASLNFDNLTRLCLWSAITGRTILECFLCIPYS